MKSTIAYFAELGDKLAIEWNRFWFTPSEMASLGLLRWVIGSVGFVYVLSFAFDLQAWFGAGGAMPLNTVRETVGPIATLEFRLSWFYLSESPMIVWTLYGVSLLVMLLATIGWKTRVTVPLAWFAALSFVHRAPMLSGHMEPILCASLLYLSIGYLRSKPATRALSLDAKLAKQETAGSTNGSQPDSMATLALRLLQIHVAGFYLLMGLTKLSGDVWWTGEAVWILIASTESSWLQPASWGRASLAINIWTHGIVIFELAFAGLIWFKILRPLLVGLSVLHWLLMIPLLGGYELSLMMLAVNVAFVAPSLLQQFPGDRTAVVASGQVLSNDETSHRSRKSKRRPVRTTT